MPEKMSEYKAVIIDDEPNMRMLLREMVADNFSDIRIVAEGASVEEGVSIIELHKPHIVFLDIEIKGGTGFHILQKVKPYSFKLIFITAFNQFAIKAIKFSAIDYILKPVNETEFVQAVNTAIEGVRQTLSITQMDNFIQHLEKEEQRKKIVLRTSDAIHLVEVSDIIYCKSDNSYTSFYLKDKKEILVSKSIKEFADLLEEYRFFRPHQSYLVNLNYVNKIDKSDGGFIILNNGKEIPVSMRRKAYVLQMVETL